MNLKHPIETFTDWFCQKVWPSLDPQEQFLSVQLDITNACNLACVHCYHPHHRNQGALGYEQWLQVLDQYEALLKKLRMIPRVTLCGGEPLLAPFLLPLLDNIRERFPICDLSVQSHGGLITDDLAKTFSRLNLSVQVSLDGPDATRNDIIRGMGSFDKAMLGCALLQKHQVPFTHQAVISERTVGWIPDFFTMAQKTGASAMNFTRLIIEGHAKGLLEQGEDRPLKGLALKKALQTVWACSKNLGVTASTRGPLWYLIDPSLGSPNNTGFSGFVVGYKGEFKVTSRSSLSLGNVLEEGLEKLFLHHPVMKRLRRGDIEGCGECQYFQKCRGDRNVSFAEFGHFFGPDTGCWLLANQARGDTL